MRFSTLFLFSTLLYISTIGYAQNNLPGYKSFDDSLISIQYPVNWDFVSPSSGLNYQISSKEEGMNDKFVENITVLILDNTEGTTLTQIATAMVPAIEKMVDNFKMISNKTIYNNYYQVQGGYQKIEYTGAYTGINVYMVMAVWLKGNKAYMIGAGSEKNKKSKYKKIFSTMLDSFEIK